MTNAITATTLTATTKKNFSKIIYRVINQIAQKFYLDSAAKKKITDFVAQRVNGEIKTVFPKEELPDGNFEYATFDSGQNLILLAYGINPDKDGFPYILYACVREIPKKEDEIKNNEMCKTLSEENLDKILLGTIGRVECHLKTITNLSLSNLAHCKLYNFLVSRQVNGRIGVLFVPEFSVSEQYSTFKLQIDDYDVNFAYGTNPIENRYPHILWVKVSKSQQAKDREFIENRKNEFREFWTKKKLPQELLEEVIQKVDMKKRITIAVYVRAADWNRYRIVERNYVAVIGQKIDNRTGEFNPNKPIGYIKGNHVVITSPENVLRLECHEFK